MATVSSRIKGEADVGSFRDSQDVSHLFRCWLNGIVIDALKQRRVILLSSVS